MLGGTLGLMQSASAGGGGAGDYITTPAATPASFGDAFEGGFYTGLIWNELVQTTTSTLIATGSQTFTVADMGTTPIVYAGQSLEVRSRANPFNQMVGTVTEASGTDLTLNITGIGGSGTFTDWSVMSKYRVIVAPKATGENASIALKNANTANTTECWTLSEGYKATMAMCAEGTSTVYPAAWWCKNLNIGGKTDWYLPARDELELTWRNLKPTADPSVLTASRATGGRAYATRGSYADTSAIRNINNSSSPQGGAYTSGSPAQVAAGKNFRTGESEAFVYGVGFIWSSTEYNNSYCWKQILYTNNGGFQDVDSKTNLYYVRAVRRSII